MMIILIGFSGFSVSAESYNYDIWGDAVPSQSGYEAVKSVSGDNLGISAFSAPADICRDSKGNFLIADSGNNRIVITDGSISESLHIITSLEYENQKITLKNPCGVYVSPYDNCIYIADTGNSRIIKCSDYENAEMIIEKPDSELYNDTEKSGFFPSKVIADKSGFIYAIVSNSSNGALMFDKNGVFQGYYGANHIDTTAEIIMKYIGNIFLTDSVRSRNSRNVPSAFANFDIDSSGFIYTCTENISGNSIVKKINSAGDNLFYNTDTEFGDHTDYYSVENPVISDIDISESGYINCLDSSSGKIFQYDENCRLVFISGGKSEQLGGFRNASAIESTDNMICVTDSAKNTITIFEITEFGDNIHNAVSLCEKGEYSKAMPLWLEALEYDGNYHIAYEEISNAYFSSKDYEKAMEYAEKAESSTLYNSAFEEYRSEHSGRYAVIMICIVSVLLIAFKKADKSIIFRIADGFDDILWRKQYSWKKTVLIIIFLFISEIANDRLYGFQFQADYSKTFSIVPYIFKSAVLFFMWTVGNWSVCCLLDGKGTFRNICHVCAYAVIPYIIQNFITALISHFLIYDEKFFIDAVMITGIIWSALMMFMAVKSVHQYSAGKTVLALVLTFVSMIIIGFIMILVFSLIVRMCSFIYTVFSEIIYRIRT